MGSPSWPVRRSCHRPGCGPPDPTAGPASVPHTPPPARYLRSKVSVDIHECFQHIFIMEVFEQVKLSRITV